MKRITNTIASMIFLITIPFFIFSQGNVGINNDNSSPDPSAMLDVKSTTVGLLPPRMTEVQRNAIENPAPGLMLWCTNCGNTGEMQVFNGFRWTNMCGSIATPGFICGTSTVTFTYNGNQVTYGTVTGANNRCWLDRNLGATQVAISSNDEASYGHLFQWGRLDDGHQVRTSSTTTTLSNSDVPGHGNFIRALSTPYDWRSPQNNNLWQGANGINNPCPIGYRLPTYEEWDTERSSWIPINAAGAFASPLKLPVAGLRSCWDGSLLLVGSYGFYWSSSIAYYATLSSSLNFNSGNAYMHSDERGAGMSVRCVKD